MTEQTQTPAAETETTQTVKTIAEGMSARRVFKTVLEASTYLNSLAEKFPDFEDQAFAMVGVDGDGDFDPTLYPDGTLVMIAALKNRGAKIVGGTRQPSTLKAIVVAPIPTLESLLADEAGTGWVEKIVQKELNHVAVRALRDAANVADVVEQIPTTREQYISSSRDMGGGIMEPFNDSYKAINSTLSLKFKSWDKARLTKNELKKALESAAYAAEYYPALEDRGEGKESLFVTACKMGQIGAKRKGTDPAIFDRWLATRDAAVFEVDAEDDDFDIEALAEAMESEEAEAEEIEEAPAEELEEAEAPAAE